MRATPRPVRTVRPTGRRGALRLVAPRRPRPPRAPFLAVVVGMLGLGLLALLALNTVLAQDAFRLHELRLEGRALADAEQALTTSVEALQAPGSLAARATALGMVPGGPPAFLRLPEGVVVEAPPTAGPSPSPSPGAGADPAARPPADAPPLPRATVAPTPAQAPTRPPAPRRGRAVPAAGASR